MTTPKMHPPKEKPKKPAKKGEKAPPVEKTTVKELFEKFEQEPPQDMKPCLLLFQIFKKLFLLESDRDGLINLKNRSVAGDGTPVYTAAQERRKRTCKCLENGIRDCNCDRIYSQPDCNIGWDSHRGRFYFGYDLYMLTASDSENDLPVFPFLGPASRHDSFGFLSKKGRTKFKCPKIRFAGGNPHGTCENPCSDAKYGRTIPLIMDDNPRLFNDPPRSSEKWKLEYNARTSAERCNKREKLDYKLEDGRYRSSKMWYCRLFTIMMCQHLDAWVLPKTSRLKDFFEQAA